MKKVKCLVLLVLFTVIATGCVKFNANMDIKKDKSMKFSIIYAFDKSIFGAENGLKEEQFDEVKKQGFTVEKYTEGSYEGFKLTKKIDNIDEVSTTEDVVYDLSGMMEAKEDNKYIFKVVKGEEKNTYTAKIKFNANDSGMTSDEDEEVVTNGVETNEEITTPDEEILTTGEDEVTTTTVEEKKEVEEISETEEIPTIGATDDDDTLDLTSDSDMDLSALTKNLDLSFNVNLPYGAISSNATTKDNDNKNLSWKLTTSGQEYMEFTFELKNNESNTSVLLYVGIGVAILVVLIVLGAILLKKKKEPVVEG